MIIRKCDDCFLIKIFKDSVGNFNIFDMENIKCLFQTIFDKLRTKYDLHGLIDAEVYVNYDYGLIIEIRPIDSYFDEIDIRIRMHLRDVFLVNIDSNSILDYKDVYYYNGKFYGTYSNSSDSEVFYKDIDDIMDRGIKVCYK